MAKKRKPQVRVTPIMHAIEPWHTLHDLLRSGDYHNLGGSPDEEILAHVRQTQEERSPHREHFLVHFDEDLTHEEAMAGLERLQLHPGLPFTLAVVGAKFPQFMEDFPIVAPGFIFTRTVFLGMQHCYVLRKEIWGPQFSACPIGGIWMEHYRFLVHRDRPG